MSNLSQTRFPDAGGFGSDGTFRWWREAPVYEEHEIPLPAGVRIINERVSSTKYNDKLLRVGGYTENMVLSSDYGMWVQGIRAPTGIPVVSLVAGPGVTGGMICYESYYDARMDEDSPLSAGSATLNAVNQKIQWTPQQPTNPRVTHIRLWRSVDGALPRVAMERQIGVGTVTEAVALADMGQAAVDVFDRLPRGRYNTTWFDRQVVSGDDQNPESIYLSLIGFPERYSFLELKTRSRERVTGIFVVNEVLVIGTQGAFEVVRGFTETDLNIDILKPALGLASHFSVAGIYDKAWLATNVGPMWTDGSGFFPVHREIQPVWEREYKLFAEAYDKQFAVHDPNRNIYMTYVGFHSDHVSSTLGNLNVWWVANYTNVIPEEGGTWGMPDWSYDVSYRSYDCAAFLVLPGGRRGDVYLGACDGNIYRTGNDSGSTGDTTDEGDQYEKQGTIRWGPDFYGDVGGDLAHGKRLVRSELFLRSESSSWEYRIYAGDEEAYARPPVGQDPIPQFSSFVLPAFADNGVAPFAPKWTRPFAFGRVTGRAFVREVILYQPTGVLLAGHQDEWREGPATRHLASTPIE